MTIATFRRRALLGAALAAPWERAFAATDADAAASALRSGGVVLALRHALAPGTFDPPGFKLGDCGTQRNLDGEGREQAARLGAWLRARGLAPTTVRSSPWCRCIDTAQGAFGQVETWDALASPTGADAQQRERRQGALRAALRSVSATGFEAWVTHQFVLQDLVGVATAPAEALVLRAAANTGKVELMARATLY